MQTKIIVFLYIIGLGLMLFGMLLKVEMIHSSSIQANPIIYLGMGVELLACLGIFYRFIIKRKK